MSFEPVSSPVVDAVAASETVPVEWSPPRGFTLPRPVLYLLLLLTGLSLLASAMLWQRLSAIQEQLARQSADSGTQAVEARTLARQAQDLARDTSTRQAVMESRLSEVAMQRSQLEDLMQSLSRTRDENLVVDIESSVRLAQQQAQLSGSVEPLLAALRTADQRLAHAAQPRLSRVRAAIGRASRRRG
jgi:uroporphyrin-3 C-methyltransferase